MQDTHKFESRYCDTLIGPYTEDYLPQIHARSPIKHIDSFNCPVAFFQGDEDKVNPLLPDDALMHHPLLPDDASMHYPLLPDDASMHHPLLPDDASMHHPLLPDDALRHHPLLPDDASMHHPVNSG